MKRKESRDFDVFFGVFKREKMKREVGQRENFRKMCPLCLGHAWGYL